MSERMRVCNSNEYNIFLKNRGKFFCLITKILPNWYSSDGAKQRGANNQYSDELILTMHTVSYITSSALRQTVGIFEEYVEQFNLNLVVPNFSTMSRRLQKLNVKIIDHRANRNSMDNIEIAVDSSGINIYTTGGGHSKENAKSRKYQHYDQVRKMHVALDLESKNILSFVYSSGTYSDHLAVKELVAGIGGNNIKSLRADRAYDRSKCYKVCYDNDIKAIIPPVKIAVIKKDKHFTDRNEAINKIRSYQNYEDGTKVWKKEIRYGKRSHVEGFFARFKRIFGFSFKNKSEINREKELMIKCNILNYFNSIGVAKFELAT